ncbi:LolA-like outer membrane lipoprotein chaperone [uncultured Helicobacter sp.]|uniref:LolA-like outer membrane lipoprotein chaperone n=1 Tax=uncultured Helicobacter sp. TaxID=175537 RepID=UPI00261B6C31|nr:LolA-like outer membrane lipoprotein chaperone [uncultured Helicobacter sp.]
MCKVFQFYLKILLKCGIAILFCIHFSNAESLKEIESFSADFTQILYSSEANAQNQIVYKGKLQALAPSSLRWSYITPIPKEIFIEENTMIIYEPKLKQAIFTQLQENLNLLYLLKNAKKITKNYYEAVILEQKYNVFLENGIPKQIIFNDTLGNKVEILFHNAKINITIDSSIFDFNPKSEIDVIYN